MAEGERRLALLGGCGGIGRALCARALAEGWKVTVLDLPASLDRHPPPAAVERVPIDLRDPPSVAAAFAGLGPLQGFVHLSGYTTSLRRLEDTSLDEFDEVMAGNFRGAYLAARAALPLLRDGGGVMVIIVSGLAAQVRPGYGLYGANKAAMVHLTRTLAVEAAPVVRVNAVAPSAVDTAFLRGGTGRSDEDAPPDVDLEAYARETPLGRMARPEDVVGPVMFLLGPDSGFMTGQVLWVNGGRFMP
ncbi:MAG: acetoacetyl-CoA reductase [Paracoccaceae bacterium]|nr:MAG: acetoacetyl-CoA reductase [Paracoccaceae bacterium]